MYRVNTEDTVNDARDRLQGLYKIKEKKRGTIINKTVERMLISKIFKDVQKTYLK